MGGGAGEGRAPGQLRPVRVVQPAAVESLVGRGAQVFDEELDPALVLIRLLLIRINSIKTLAYL